MSITEEHVNKLRISNTVEPAVENAAEGTCDKELCSDVDLNLSIQTLTEFLKPIKEYGDDISFLTASSIKTISIEEEIVDPFINNIFLPKLSKHEVYKPETVPLTIEEEYIANCHEYNTPPLSTVLDVMNTNEDSFDMNSYGCDDVNLYLIFKAFLGPPIIKITSLNLSNNRLTEESCITLSEFLRRSFIQKLNLSNTEIGGAGMEILVEGIEYAEELSELNLSKCNLTDIGGVAIAQVMESNDTIINLNLSYNKLSNQSANALGVMFIQNSTLEIIDLKWNDLYAELPGMKMMNGIRRNKSLQELNLSWNGLCGEGITESAASAFRFHKNLRILYLENNVFSEEEFIIIVAAIKRSKSLREVYLGGNLWTTESVTAMLKGELTNINLISFGKYFYFPTPMYELLLKLWERYPELQVISHGKELPEPPEKVVPENLLLDRCKFLAMKPKRKSAKRNMGHFMLILQDSKDDYMKIEAFEEALKAFKAKLDPNLEKDLKNVFTEKQKVGPSIQYRINTRRMAEMYLSRHPTEPPPVVERKAPSSSRAKKDGAKLKKPTK